MSSRVASCSCGQLRAEVAGEPVRISICHCDACQRRTGNVFATQARFPRDAVTIHGHGKQYVRVNEEGSTGRFTFCETCGAIVFYVIDGSEQHIAIPIGAFADPTFPAPTVSVYEEYMHPWVGLPEEITHIF